MSSERLLLEKKSPWWGEHYHRYHEALNYIKEGDKVLDIASGTGYGSSMLAEKAGEVIAGDIDKESIVKNKELYSQENLDFKVLDGTNLPFDDNFFDVLTSFETIEHTTEYEKMLKEFKRVTKNGGTLIISTPNKLLNSPNGTIVNKYHTQEWTPEEFEKLIQSNFDNFTIYGQLYNRYNDNNLKNKVALGIENLFYLRGIRKIPISIQDRVMQTLISKNQYPEYTDYIYTQDKDKIREKCVTQIAIINN